MLFTGVIAVEKHIGVLQRYGELLFYDILSEFVIKQLMRILQPRYCLYDHFAL